MLDSKLAYIKLNTKTLYILWIYGNDTKLYGILKTYQKLYKNTIVITNFNLLFYKNLFSVFKETAASLY